MSAPEAETLPVHEVSRSSALAHALGIGPLSKGIPRPLIFPAYRYHFFSPVYVAVITAGDVRLK